jgi:hypothetical protein
MQALEAVRRRLRHQHLTGPRLRAPADVVRHLGAVQSQEFAVAKWSLGQRCAARDDPTVQRAVDDGAVLRTHALRPTWHFVAPADLVWIQQLTGPRVHVLNRYHYRRLGIDGPLAARAAQVICEALSERHLTRPELGAALAAGGIEASGIRLGYLVMYLELEALIVSGRMRGKGHTYALVSERAPDARRLEPDAALAELTRRYFASHGPATAKDFSWWSSLTLAQISRGLDLVGDELVPVDVDGLTCWHAPGRAPAPGDAPSVQVLQAYDELGVAYTESRRFGNVAGLDLGAPANTLIHLLALEGQLIGFWRRFVRRDGLEAQVSPARPLSAAERAAVDAAFAEYAGFAGVPVRVSWQQ